MLNLQRMKIFTAVVEAGSFTAAAEVLDQSKAVVSFNVKQLEAELGVSLLRRSTRKISLTEPGKHFYQNSLRLLADAEHILNDVRHEHHSLSGVLRVTSTPEYGAHKVVPALAAFAKKHPQLHINYISSPRHADLIAEYFDIAIRLGEVADSNYHAAYIDNFSIFPVSSPNYLATNNINTLSDLAQANWITNSRLKSPLRWQVITPQKETVLLNVESPSTIKADSASALLAFTLNGTGIALIPEWLVHPALEQGQLIHLLPEYIFPLQNIYAIYPNTRYVPEKVRAFIDFLREW
ncbi:LysR family transcriptional regulator [Moritella yayanosii]|uniref:HTH-type transcriptional regulator PtxR n=1 Tax=Moritella yayanosii TaxID=69539 RepID=A0A330LVM4_9GAMM|nr:LysR family transcriptional regulator [Moritella yayanosii]SQD78105.1 HTH-type transcriptional regulator PtxR [Moritella yayanosii]